MAELSRKELLMAVISGKGPAYLRCLDLSNLDLSGVGWLMDADLREANLTHADLSRANLRNARMEKANLHGANLAGANVAGGDLRNCNLVVANLRMVNLAGANLQGANLVGANLSKANLENVNFEGADLEGANLERANLKNANLNSATLKMANLREAVLEGAKMDGTFLDNTCESPADSSDSSGFTGSLYSIQLMDLIQLVCISRSSLLIRLASSEGRGTIHVRCGEICHAETGELAGEEAFVDMFRWKNGRFETFPVPAKIVVTIDKPFEHLLVEAMRRQDEMGVPHVPGSSGNLLEEIKNNVPFPAYPSEELQEFLDKEGKDIGSWEEFRLVDAFPSPETGEILCSLVAGDEVFIAPLMCVKIMSDHPLFDMILDYQSASPGTEGSCRPS